MKVFEKSRTVAEHEHKVRETEQLLGRKEVKSGLSHEASRMTACDTREGGPGEGIPRQARTEPTPRRARADEEHVVLERENGGSRRRSAPSPGRRCPRCWSGTPSTAADGSWRS